MNKVTLRHEETEQSGSPAATTGSCNTGGSPNRNRLMKLGIVGAVITALCCFTPVLVVLFGVLGIAGLVGYLDYVLFPLLAVFLVLIGIASVRAHRQHVSSVTFKNTAS